MSDIAKRLRKLAATADGVPIFADAADEIERLEEALSRIVQWADAYPTDVFHEPSKEECRRAHELLTANGMTLDAFSASMGRHCMDGVGKIARAALEEKP